MNAQTLQSVDLGYKPANLAFSDTAGPTSVLAKPFGGLLFVLDNGVLYSVFKNKGTGTPLVLDKVVGIRTTFDLVAAEEKLFPNLALRTSRFSPAEVLSFII